MCIWYVLQVNCAVIKVQGFGTEVRVPRRGDKTSVIYVYSLHAYHRPLSSYRALDCRVEGQGFDPLHRANT